MTNSVKFELREQTLGNDEYIEHHESFIKEIWYFDSRCYDSSLLNYFL